MTEYEFICDNARKELKRAYARRRRNLKKGYDVESEDLHIAGIREHLRQFKKAYRYLLRMV